MVGPASGTEGLEEVGVTGVEVGGEFELCGGEGDGGDAEVAFEVEEGFVEAGHFVLVGIEVPVGDDEVGDFPAVVVLLVEGEGVAGGVVGVSFDDAEEAGEAAGFLGVGFVAGEEFLVGFLWLWGLFADAEVVALALVDFGDGG